MTSPATTPSVLWAPHPVSHGETRRVDVGPLSVFLRREDDEFWVTWSRTGPDVEEEEPGPDPASWTRWVGAEEGMELRLFPTLPDRPVVVEPELAFHLLREARATVFVRVPLWIRIEIARRQGEVLAEVPTLTLSDTWWGTIEEGELCYWIPTTARRRLTPELLREPHLVACPLQLINRSEDDLHVEKIALRVEHLSIFRSEQGLWADETVVKYRGEAEGSDLHVTGRPPELAGETRLLTAPRVPLARGFRARTFARFRAFHHGGLFG